MCAPLGRGVQAEELGVLFSLFPFLPNNSFRCMQVLCDQSEIGVDESIRLL